MKWSLSERRTKKRGDVGVTPGTLYRETLDPPFHGGEPDVVATTLAPDGVLETGVGRSLGPGRVPRRCDGVEEGRPLL